MSKESKQLEQLIINYDTQIKGLNLIKKEINTLLNKNIIINNKLKSAFNELNNGLSSLIEKTDVLIKQTNIQLIYHNTNGKYDLTSLNDFSTSLQYYSDKISTFCRLLNLVKSLICKPKSIIMNDRNKNIQFQIKFENFYKPNLIEAFEIILNRHDEIVNHLQQVINSAGKCK